MNEDLKQLESLSYKPDSVLTSSGQPIPLNASAKENIDNPNPCFQGENLKIIKEIEGLISQVNEKIEQLGAPTTTDSTVNEKLRLKSQAFEEINLFETTTLFKLRKLYEIPPNMDLRVLNEENESQKQTQGAPRSNNTGHSKAQVG